MSWPPDLNPVSNAGGSPASRPSCPEISSLVLHRAPQVRDLPAGRQVRADLVHLSGRHEAGPQRRLDGPDACEMVSCMIGTRSSTTSTITGRPTRTTFTLTSFAAQATATVPAGWAITAGKGSPRSARAAPGRCSTARCRARRPIPRTQAFLGWRFIRRRLGDRVHFWPFDGWEVPAGRSSAVVEVHPTRWAHLFPRDANRTRDQHDAYYIAAWLSQAARDGSLMTNMRPGLQPAEAAQARIKGWNLGVLG